MKYTKLGKTDINVSVMALGCWPFDGVETWGDQYDADSIETVHAALDSGIIYSIQPQLTGDPKKSWVEP